MKVPLVDLAAAHREVESEVRDGLERVFAATAFIQGEDVDAFEREYAGLVGSRCCVAVSNGTDALELALRAAGIGAGDQVLVPANTFIASALAVVRCGAEPVFVDCDEEHLLLDVEDTRRKVGDRTRAVMPVDLFGQVAPMEKVEALAEEAGLLVIEDAAQAQGAARRGRGAGTFGLAAGTSFYPGKNLGAYGDGGAVTTDDEELAERVRALRSYGSTEKYRHPTIGFNCRLDTVQAVVLRAKLRRLQEWNESRRRAAALYDRLLAGEPRVRRPATLEGNLHVHHLYPIRVAERDRVLAELQSRGIGAQIHYPRPLHLTGAFRSLGGEPGDLPVAEKAAGELLSLPIYPQIERRQQERVVEELTAALARAPAAIS